MNRRLNNLARRYRAALRAHLKQGPRTSALVAARLGRQAVDDGLETLDMVRIHEQALAGLVPASGLGRARTRAVKRAASFFAKVIMPIEQTHRGAVGVNTQMKHLAKTLGQRTADLTASHRELQEGIAGRRAAEQALQESGQRHAELLAESRRLQKHLRQLTHQILAAQEEERQKISRELHDEVAQTLLGINVRLVTLRRATAVNTGGLKKEIASTQRLVKNSVKTMSRFAREFGKRHDP